MAELVFAALDSVAERSGWHAAAVDPPSIYVRAWRHRSLPIEVHAVAISCYPLALAIGSGGPVGVAAFVLGGRARRLLRRLRGEAARIGGILIPDGALAGHLAGSRASALQAEAMQVEIAKLEHVQQHRQCPACGTWCFAASRWCWECDYQFSGEDDHMRDTVAIAARQRLAWLRGQALYGSHTIAPAPPPLSILPGVPRPAFGGSGHVRGGLRR